MSNKKTTTIPTAVGSSNLTETFGKINFTNEVKELLAALEAELTIRYIPGGEKPIISVLSKTGKTVCSLEEFKALSGYRRFVKEAIKEVEKEKSTNKKIELIAFFIRRKVDVPARILEQNYTKFNQIGASLELIAKHMDVIDGTIDNDWKIYLQDMLVRVSRVLLSAQTECMGADVLSKSYIEEEIFKLGVPKWIYTKLLDKSFTNNLRDNSKTLLFPKNNYLKCIAFTTLELNNEGFMTKNKLVLEKSGGIIALARTNWDSILPGYKPEMAEEMNTFKEKYMWTLTDPQSADEVLIQRETGKKLPVYREVQVPRATGNRRPETETARILREAGNMLGKIQATWNGIMNYAIPVANPKTEFWAILYENTDSWDITPTNTLYNCIRNTRNPLGPLEALRNGTLTEVLERIGIIIAQVLQIPGGTEDCTTIVEAIRAIKNRTEFVKMVNFNDPVDTHLLRDLSPMETNPVTREELITAKAFLGIKEGGKKKAKKPSNMGAVRLHTKVKNELSPLEQHAIYDKVYAWIGTTFKTGSREIVQLVAAERILGEALKHQGEIFGEEFDEEEILEEIEDYYED